MYEIELNNFGYKSNETFTMYEVNDVQILPNNILKLCINDCPALSSNASKIIGEQIQKQLDEYSLDIFNNALYKTPGFTKQCFSMNIKIYDGVIDYKLNLINFVSLSKCYIVDVKYSDVDYSSLEPLFITMLIKYDGNI